MWHVDVCHGVVWCGRLGVRAGVEWHALTLYSLSPPPADPTCLKVMMLVARRGLKSGTRARFNPARLFHTGPAGGAGWVGQEAGARVGGPGVGAGAGARVGRAGVRVVRVGRAVGGYRVGRAGDGDRAYRVGRAGDGGGGYRVGRAGEGAGAIGWVEQGTEAGAIRWVEQAGGRGIRWAEAE